MRRFQELSPVSDRDKFFDSQSFTALWASLAFGLPAFVVGVRLTAGAGVGGLGLTLGQLLFVVPLATLIGAVLLAAVSWVAADQGVPAGLLMRPSFGVAGSWVGATLIATFYLAWASLEIQAGGHAIAAALTAGGIINVPDGVAIGVFAVGTAALVYVGLALATRWWIRAFAFWAVLILFLVALIAVLLALGDGVLDTIPRVQGFWLGVDMIVAAMIVWFPLAADTGRFASDTSVATSGTGYGFGIGSAAAVVVGGLAGLTRVIEPSFSGLTGAVLSTGSTLVVLVVVLGVLAAELDQPFALIYGASTSVSSTVLRRPPGLLGEGLVVAAAAAALLVSEGSLFEAVQFLATLVAPLIVILLADFFLVRGRRYLTDGLYDRSGPYRGMNLLGLFAYMVAFSVTQFIEPSGPHQWLDFVERLAPSAGSLAEQGVPPVLTGMMVGFVVYTLIGRWTIKDIEQISAVRL